MKYFSAIKCISNRIVELKAEIESCKKILNESKIESVLFFTVEDINNINIEIEKLKESIIILINQ